MNQPIIEINNLSKSYTISHNRPYETLRESMVELAKKPFYLLKGGVKQKKEDFWALKNINFSVNQGEKIGIIGHNGAGKSTILKILSQITFPTKGEVKLRGRVASLLEVGTGFHPELTGRENIYLNGAILGMKQSEIKNKFDEIVEFSGIKQFLDTPVKRYSSGMHVRLAFAVAAHLEPEILLIDEVLAVGDIEFQKKCLGKMKDVSKLGRTIIFVSHNMSAIQNLCKKCILIEKGEIKLIDETSKVIDKYIETQSQNKPYAKFKPNYSRKYQLLEISINNAKGEIDNHINYQDHFSIELVININVKNKNYYTLIIVRDSMGNAIFVTTDEDIEESFISKFDKGKCRYRVKFPSKFFKPGQYYITLSLTSKDKIGVDNHDSVLNFEITDSTSRRTLNNGYRTIALTAPEIAWIPKVID